MLFYPVISASMKVEDSSTTRPMLSLKLKLEGRKLNELMVWGSGMARQLHIRTTVPDLFKQQGGQDGSQQKEGEFPSVNWESLGHGLVSQPHHVSNGRALQPSTGLEKENQSQLAHTQQTSSPLWGHIAVPVHKTESKCSITQIL